MDKLIDNEMLRKALEIYEDKRLCEYDDLEEFVPSEKFEKRMERLIKSRNNYFYTATKTRFRKALTVAAVAAVLVTSALSVTAIRETILGFFVSRGSEVDVIEYNTENAKDYPKTIEKLFELKNIPEGYALEDETSDEISSELYFVKDDEHYLDFQQFTKDSYSSVSDGEFSAPEKIKDGAQQFIIRTSGKMIMLVWEKDGYVFEMTGFLGKNEMLKIAQSAQPKGE